MIKVVIQCSDIHIRPYLRLEEYAEQLQKFVEKCKEITKDYKREEIRIVICGDIFVLLCFLKQYHYGKFERNVPLHWIPGVYEENADLCTDHLRVRNYIFDI